MLTRCRPGGLLLAALLVVAIGAGGCASTMPDRAERMERGYVYYLDGAGGGGAVRNYSGGVRQGLKDAGYSGAGEMFSWETGLGVTADQVSSNEYKRGKAAELARKIQAYHREHPQAPITLMGLSAGTAVAVFTLEALPPDIIIDNVILLSGSLSSTHNLTAALRHVKGKMYVFTSQHDAVLTVAVPMSGTADRDAGTTDTIGVQGPRVPGGAPPATRQLYASKIVQIPWTEKFAMYGNRGGHTDTVKGPFVQHYVAPLVLAIKPAALAAARPAGGQVANPDYRRWAGFAPGSGVEFEGHQVVAGSRTPVRVRVRLVSRSAETALVSREYVGEAATGAIPSQLFAPAVIQPQEHAFTHPGTRTETRPPVRITIEGRAFECQVKTFAADGDFPGWGRSPRGTVYACDEIPGGIARLELHSELDGKPMELCVDAIHVERVRS